MKTPTPFFTLILVSIAALSACDLDKKRDGTAAENPKAVYAYFISQQVASNDFTVALGSSYLYGFPFSAAKEWTYAPMASREPSCVVNMGDGPALPEGARIENIGEISLGGLTPSELTPFEKTADNFFVFNKPLPPGEFEINGTGINNALQIKQPFIVPSASTRILVQSGETDGTAVLLPAPAVPVQADANYMIPIKRDQNLYLAYDVPEGTTYVRIVIKDWTRNANGLEVAEHTLQCYQPASTEGMGIPPDFLTQFRLGEEATLAVDFVNASLDTSVPRLQESYIESFTRHYHGKVVVGDGQGGQIVKRLGVFYFE